MLGHRVHFFKGESATHFLFFFVRFSILDHVWWLFFQHHVVCQETEPVYVFSESVNITQACIYQIAVL